MIHTPENPVIRYKRRSKWEEEQEASVERGPQAAAGKEWSLWEALVLYWVEECGSESQFMILMFY